MPEQIRTQTRLAIRFADIDALGHVNNAIYLNYFEEARIAFFKEIGGGVAWDWKIFGLLLARNEIDYIEPIFFNDEIEATVWCEKVGNTSMKIAYRFEKIKNGIRTECTKGKSVLVCYDYEKRQKIKVPELWREKLNA